MLRQFRLRITYANVVSTLCLFILLGGSAYAAATIGSAEIKDDSVKSVDVRDEASTGGGLRGRDIVESSLGKVPNADKLDGKDSSELGVRAYAFVQGSFCSPSAGNACLLDRKKNIAYAIRVSRGTYCVGVNGIDASAPNSLAITGVADLGSNADQDQTVVWQKRNSACVAREFEVQVYKQPYFDARRADGGISQATTPGRLDDRDFVLAIP